MRLQFMVAPDFAPDRFGGWHMFNALLQQRSGLQVHLLTPASAGEQAALLAAGTVDLLYANPFDAALLIRQQGWCAFARPVERPDEMVVATAADSPLLRLEDLRPGHRVALTDNRDLRLIGLRLLEAADLAEADLQWRVVASHQAAARLAIAGEVDAAFFLAELWHGLTRLTRSRLRPLIESAIHDLSHVLLAHPRQQPGLAALQAAVTGVGRGPRDDEVLQALGLPKGFEPMDAEAAEFMVDLMDTLLD